MRMVAQLTHRQRRRVRIALMLIAVGSVVVPLDAARGQIEELRPGARARIRAPGALGGEAEGIILARRADTVVVGRPGAASVDVPVPLITRASVYRGRTSGAGALEGAKWGAGIGLGLGLANMGFSDCSGEHCGAGDNVVGVATFAALGAGVGSLVGAVVGSERWERLRLPSRAAASPVAAVLK